MGLSGTARPTAQGYCPPRVYLQLSVYCPSPKTPLSSLPLPRHCDQGEEEDRL